MAVIIPPFVLISKLEDIKEDIHNLRHYVEECENKRLYAKCNGLFGRLIRELKKLPDFNFSYQRHDYNTMFITAYELEMTVGIREDAESYTPGQFVGCGLPTGAIHGCEVNLESFAKQVQWTLKNVSENPDKVKLYWTRRALSPPPTPNTFVVM